MHDLYTSNRIYKGNPDYTDQDNDTYISFNSGAFNIVCNGKKGIESNKNAD